MTLDLQAGRRFQDAQRRSLTVAALSGLAKRRWMSALRRVLDEASTVIDDERRGEHVAALCSHAERLSLDDETRSLDDKTRSLDDERLCSNHQPLDSNHPAHLARASSTDAKNELLSIDDEPR